MIDELLQIVAPHHCYGCGKTGPIVCADCKYNIIDEAVGGCIMCLHPAPSGICSACRTSYEKAWHLGSRADVLKRCIDAYKFERVRAAHKTLAGLLDGYLPVFPEETVIIPVPTIPSHIRQRGYDHTLIMAKRLAASRSLRVSTSLKRISNVRQRGALRTQRFVQAESAFACDTVLSPDVPYLVVDDVMTTGATLQYAAAALKQAGAREVWVAVLARQPLEKR